MTYIVQFHSYCGMEGIPREHDERAEARADVASVIRARRRAGYYVVTLDDHRWEVCEPEDSAMVADDCGVLSLTRQTFDCLECGGYNDTPEDAASCCPSF